MSISYKKIEMLDQEVLDGLNYLDSTPEVKEILFANGYRAEDLEDLRKTQRELHRFYSEKESKNLTKRGLTAAIRKLRTRLNGHYRDTAGSLKMALKNDKELLAKLGLDERIEKRTTPFLERARDFYAKANDEEILAKAVGYGVKPDVLVEGIKLVDQMDELYFQRHQMDSEKRAATKQRNETYKQLKMKWRALGKTLKRIFANEPHLVKGIINVSSFGSIKPTKKKGAAPPAAQKNGGKD